MWFGGNRPAAGVGSAAAAVGCGDGAAAVCFLRPPPLPPPPCRLSRRWQLGSGAGRTAATTSFCCCCCRRHLSAWVPVRGTSTNQNQDTVPWLVVTVMSGLPRTIVLFIVTGSVCSYSLFLFPRIKREFPAQHPTFTNRGLINDHVIL